MSIASFGPGSPLSSVRTISVPAASLNRSTSTTSAASGSFGSGISASVSVAPTSVETSVETSVIISSVPSVIASVMSTSVPSVISSIESDSSVPITSVDAPSPVLSESSPQPSASKQAAPTAHVVRRIRIIFSVRLSATECGESCTRRVFHSTTRVTQATHFCSNACWSAPFPTMPRRIEGRSQPLSCDEEQLLCRSHGLVTCRATKISAPTLRRHVGVARTSYAADVRQRPNNANGNPASEIPSATKRARIRAPFS